jgi:hypothetical protein
MAIAAGEGLATRGPGRQNSGVWCDIRDVTVEHLITRSFWETVEAQSWTWQARAYVINDKTVESMYTQELPGYHSKQGFIMFLKMFMRFAFSSAAATRSLSANCLFTSSA